MRNFIVGLLSVLSLSVFGYETINLTNSNTVVLNEGVNTQSVAKVQGEIFKKAANLDSDKPIYLVLDTPGGSIMAGNLLIDTIRGGVANPVHTITIFAASMGYQIAQNLGTRYVLPSGILMSHRAYIGGVRGQVPGEANSMLNFIGNIVEDAERKAANRVGIPLKQYQESIRDELWLFGSQAVKTNHADKVVFAKCGTSLLKSRFEKVRVFGTTFKVEYSKCPLIRGLIGYERISRRNEFTMQAEKRLTEMFGDKVQYFRNYVKGKELVQ